MGVRWYQERCYHAKLGASAVVVLRLLISNLSAYAATIIKNASVELATITPTIDQSYFA